MEKITALNSEEQGGWPISGGFLRLLPTSWRRSYLYRDLLPAINSRKVDLLEDARLFAQIVGLERRTARGGKDSIDHAPGAHDDLANSVAGVVAALASSAHGYDSSIIGSADPSPAKAFRCGNIPTSTADVPGGNKMRR